MKNMEEIEQLIENDGFITLPKQTIDVMYGDEHLSEENDILATVRVDSCFVEFCDTSKTFPSLTDIPFVSELIKRGFKTNIMLIEGLPESFRTADQVRKLVYDHLTDIKGEAPFNTEVDDYIKRRLISDAFPHYSRYIVVDMDTMVRWLMTPTEWDALHDIFPKSVPMSQVVNEVCESLQKDDVYNTARHLIDITDVDRKVLATIDVDNKYIEISLGCSDTVFKISTIKELIVNGYHCNYQIP